MKRDNLRKKGSVFEEIAVAYLKNKNYIILERNWVCHWCEIDIIATETAPNSTGVSSGILVFVEVKFCANRFYDLSKIVSRRKLISQKRAINSYLYLNKKSNTPKFINFRFDLISITKKNNKFLLQHFADINLG